MSTIWCYTYVLAFCCLWSSCHGQFSPFTSGMNNASVHNHHHWFESAILIQTGLDSFTKLIHSHFFWVMQLKCHMSIYVCSPGMLIIYSSSHLLVWFHGQLKKCVAHMLQPMFSFDTRVLLHSAHVTHRVPHSTLSRKTLGRFHPSSYKIMDGHHTSLGAFTAHHGPHKDFIYGCWITPLSLLFSPSFLFAATAHTLIVDDRAAYRRPLC